MMKKIISVVLIFATVISLFPSNVIATELFSSVNTNQNKTESVNYGAVIGNTAVFAGYFPTPISDMPEKVNNLWGTDSQFLFSEDVTSDMVFVITDYYLSPEGHLWYKLDAAPGSEMPERLKTFPWVYQVTVSNPFDATLIVHESGKNFIFDAEGNPVTEVTIGLYDKYEISCKSSLLGVPEYRWQIFIAGEWVNIAGNATSSMSISRALLINALDSNNQTKVRCITKSGSKEVVGEPVVVRLDPSSDNLFEVPSKNEDVTERMVEVPPINMKASAVADGTDVVYVTVQFLFENGTQAANSYVAEVPYGVPYSFPVEFPYVLGYKSTYMGEYMDGTTVTGVFTEAVTFTVYYEPTEVKYYVDVYFQNIENDNYSFQETIPLEGLTGTLVDKKEIEKLLENYEGMLILPHETPEIAADGSTHVEVYFDREYFMTTVELGEGGYGVYSVYARYGSNLIKHLVGATRPGYTFEGWDLAEVDTNGDGKPDSGDGKVEDNVYETVPAFNLTYIALWKAAETVKVRIVFWGEKAGVYDSTEEFVNGKTTRPFDPANYEYLETKTVDVAPGATLKYAVDVLSTGNNYLCGIETHFHDETCCKDKHTHSIKCYQTTNSQTLPPLVSEQTNTIKNAFTSSGLSSQKPADGTIARYRTNSYTSTTYYDFLYYDGNWYYLGNLTSNITSQTTNYGITYQISPNPNRNQTNSTTVSMKCNHTHSTSCIICGLEESQHVHTAANCGYPTFEDYKDNSNLWYLAEYDFDAVTVDPDGTTVLNVYFNRTPYTLSFTKNNSAYTVTTRWGADINSIWPVLNVTGDRWDPSPKNTFTAVLVYISQMPAEDISFTVSPGSGKPTFIMHYMVEITDDEVKNESSPYRFRVGNSGEYKYFKEHNTITAKYSHLTKAEDFMDLTGYVQYGSNPTFNSSNQITKAGDVYLYYTRLESTLELYSGMDLQSPTVKMAYGEKIGDYIKTVTPAVPSDLDANGYYFTGEWYLNPECTGNAVDLDTLTMPAGPFALYAKWEKKEHEVRIVLNKKDDGNYTTEDYVLDPNGEPLVFTVTHGDTVFKDNPERKPAEPTYGKYDFLNWFYMKNGSELVWDFDSQPVVDDTVIYAKWSSDVMIQYTVYFVDQKGNQIADPIIRQSLAGHSVTVNAKTGKELYEEYRNKYFPQVVSHSIALDIENRDTGVEYTFVYERAESKKYYIHYLDSQTNEYLNKEKGPVEKESDFAVVTEKYLTIEGAEKYVPDAYQKSLILSANESENHLYFYYSKTDEKDVWYIGYHVQDKDNLALYDEVSSTGGVDKIGLELQAEWPVDLNKDGFKFSHAIITKDGNEQRIESNIENVKSQIVKGGTKIDVYFNRNTYSYKVVYINMDTGKEIPGREPDVYIGDNKQPYGKTVKADASKIPTITGYKYASSSSCTIVKDGDTEATITKNIIYVYYTENTISIKFEVVGPDGCGTVEPSVIEVKYDSDASATADARPAANYKFVGWYYDKECTRPITTTSKLIPNGTNLILRKDTGWEPNTYYAKFEADVMDLTIERTNGEAGQVYVYEVKNQSTGDIIYVTITGSGQVTIKDLVVGTYVITQQNGWSWRQADPSQTVEHNEANRGNPVVFSESATNNKWLNGNSTNNKNKRGN